MFKPKKVGIIKFYIQGKSNILAGLSDLGESRKIETRTQEVEKGHIKNGYNNSFKARYINSLSSSLSYLFVGYCRKTDTVLTKF